MEEKILIASSSYMMLMNQFIAFKLASTNWCFKKILEVYLFV